MDRVLVSEAKGRGFDSHQAHHLHAQSSYQLAMPKTHNGLVLATLQNITDTYTNRGLDEYLVEVEQTIDTIHIQLRTPYPCEVLHEKWTHNIKMQLQAHGKQATVTYSIQVVQHATQANTRPHRTIKNIVAVVSGKGGVGKSTSCVNLALALQAQGARVGILDADLYGPSIPTMLGATKEQLQNKEEGTITPLVRFGMQVMSIGFLVKDTDAMIWRGPMATNTLKQLFNATRWGELDYLLVDFPPGTGDIPLTLVQSIPLAGAVVITTPQSIALADVKRGIEMLRKVGVVPLGIVENMNLHTCPQCGHTSHIFNKAKESIADEYALPVLGELPLDAYLCERMDAGKPPIATSPQGAISQLYKQAASRLAARLSTQPIYVASKAQALGHSILNLRKPKR